MRRLVSTGVAHARRVVAVALAAAVSAAGLAGTLQTQEPNVGPPASAAGDTATRGPTFYTVRASDGERVDARNSPVLERRISLTLIGIPLGMAVQAIADRAGLETTFNPETIPLGARVSMKGDDVTVAAALRWVLVNARVDVLLQGNTRLTLLRRSTLVPQASPVASEDSSGALAGELVDSETGEPVPYGSLTLLGTELGRFSDSTGHFRMARLPAQRYIVRARQIGYSPVDSTVAVAFESTTRLTIRMRRVPAMLGLVNVEGRRRNGCVTTGIPDSTVDPTLAAIFVQVHENVDRYDLLLREYPFRYLREEQVVHQRLDGSDEVRLMDTVAYESQKRRPYRIGGLIYRDSLVRQDSVFRDLSGHSWQTRSRCPAPCVVNVRTEVTARRRLMELPTFADLVDSAFLAAHCFEYGGTTGGKGSARLIRVNFEPAKSIKTPDVSGSVYLDADTLVLRRAVFEMTKSEAAVPPVAELTLNTTFREILPLVPIVDSVESRQPTGILTTRGSDRLIGFSFEGATPGEQPPTPPERTTVASAARGDTAVAGPAATLEVDPGVTVTSPAATLAVDPKVAGARPTATLAVNPGVTRVHAVFPADNACRPAAAVDTISVLLYATLHGHRPRGLSDSAWSTYTSDVLNALSEAFALPDTLSLTAFSWPFEHAVQKDGSVRDRAVDLSAGEARSRAFVPLIDSSKPPSGTLAVVVLDDVGDPVPFAAMWLAGTSEQRRTDLTGASRIPGLHPGAYLLQLRRIGYAPQDTTIRVRAGPAVTTDTIYTGRVAVRLAVVTVQGRNAGPFVMPMMSTVVTLTLGADGSLKDVRLAASTASTHRATISSTISTLSGDNSPSDAADGLVVAAVRRTAAAHAFPQLGNASDHVRTVSADLVVSMAEPAPGEQAVALARLDAPAWPSVGAAQLVKMPSPPPKALSDFMAGGPAADTAAFEVVVSDRGEALPATARPDYSVARSLIADYREPYLRRLMLSLREFRFDAGRIAGCRVPEFVRQSFGYRWPQQ